MNYSFEYIDIILLAMIAGFIFLRLRGILGKKSGYEDKMSASFAHDFPSETSKKPLNEMTFDENAKKEDEKQKEVAKKVEIIKVFTLLIFGFILVQHTYSSVGRATLS